jgi:Ca-activated chloride channel family protein
MSFLWPGMLVLLLGVPLLVLGYLALVRRRDQRAAELAAQGFVPTASAQRRRRRRHVPFAFFLVAVVVALVALARPEASLSIPRREGTVVLAFDASNSMRATDLEPSRMDAAKAAARTFVQQQPSSIEIGVVAFSDGGLVTLPPTRSDEEVLAAIDRLTSQGATSLGQGIFTALSAISGRPITVEPGALEGDIDNIDIGYFGSSAVILLSDGENTSEPDPLDVAELAAVAGVKIYPIGLGSPDGTVVEVDGFNVATALDEQLLEDIASVTDGHYFRAEDANELAQVYDQIDLQFVREAEYREITGILTGISLLLLVVGATLSLLWFGRLV